MELHSEENTQTDTRAVVIRCDIKHYLDRHSMVNAFLEYYEGTNVPIVNVLCSYDDYNGYSYIVCVNQYLYFKDENVALF